MLQVSHGLVPWAVVMYCLHIGRTEPDRID